MNTPEQSEFDEGDFWAGTPGGDAASHRHYQWFERVARDVQDDYERLHGEAQSDPQRAGHGAESTWVQLLEHWLPASYEVGTRKYIVPEIGDKTFETDLVVFWPAYPSRLRDREEVLAGGVAAAFSVKLTLDAAGLRDAVTRAVSLKKGFKTRTGTPRDEMLGPLAVGLLAQTHSWTKPGSQPAQTVTRALRRLDRELVDHPRESLDYLCVPDLSTWPLFRAPHFPDWMEDARLTTHQREEGVCMSSVMTLDRPTNLSPVAALVASLYVRLAGVDPACRPVADGLRMTGTLGRQRGVPRFWPTRAVFSADVREALPDRLRAGDPDWPIAFMA